MQEAVVGKVLFSRQEIGETVSLIARQIEEAYRDSDDVLVIVLLTGAKWFADDLLAEINDEKFKVEYIKVSSYHGQTSSSGEVDIKGHIEGNISGREVLIIDDIYDTGLTLERFIHWLKQKGPSAIKTCVLLEKQCQHKGQVDIDFAGLEAPDVFLVGYGLDYNQQYRELPFIAQLDISASK